MLNKHFSQDLHDKYDEIGKAAAKKLFKRWNINLKDNPDKYGIDLIAYQNEELYGYVEVEVRESWKEKQFPFSTLNIPCRKRKLLETASNNCLVAFNADCSMAFVCKDWTILFSDIEEVKNKHLKKNEFFFKVPINQIQLVKV
jgi:hypothetical protein